MRLLHTSKLRLLLLSVLFVSLLFSGMPQLAQTRTQLGEPAGHVNDFAGVVSERTRKQLEQTLETLKAETKIHFTIATVPTTGEQDIASFSRQLAREWNLGSPTSSTKSLLLVISIKERDLFTRFSRSVQSSLPDGALGEMSRRVRPEIGSEVFSDVLSTGVLSFITALGERVGFSLPTLEQPQDTVTDTQIVAASSPSPSPQDEADGTVTAPPPITEEKTPPVRRSRRAGEAPASATSKISVKEENSERDADESEEVELTLTLPLDERVGALREFLRLNPNSKSKARAIELLVSAHATLGDQKLKAADNVSGVEHLLHAITEGPAEMSDQLFSGVIAQIPLNLYLRGERETAFKAASMIEAKHGSEPHRLLSLASFFLGLEMGGEAVRLAERAVQLAPEMGEAHRVLALGLHISLRLDEAISEYQRGLELDPSLKGARRSLADLYRASSNPKEALGLYRSILELDPTDKAARAGVVISLLDLKRIDEAESEFQAALADDSKNLALLTGVAYWYAAHKDTKRALELALKAADVEPRYTWTQIALARALLGERRPLDAERAIRFARQYGKFATLDYELANVLAATGLFEEAAEVLVETFQIVEGDIQTRLAGQVQARAGDFIELLSPERRAGIFQAVGADTPENAQKLKALLEFAIANQKNTGEPSDEATIVKTGRAFAEGSDGMHSLRKLYVATRLLRKGIAFEDARDLALEARSGVEEALDHPAATVAIQADEYRTLRAQAIASGGTPEIAVAPRNALSNLLRGRIEELAGWALYNLDKPEEAAERFRRAVSVLPDGTPLWRSTLWRLGAALEQLGKKEEAFGYYVRSYNTGDPDPARLSVIERLYEDLNGSLEGIDRYVGPGATLATSELQLTTSAAPSAEEAVPSPSPEETPPAPAGKTEREVEPASTPEVEPSPAPSEPEPTPSPDSTPEPSPSPSEAPAKRKTDTARLSEQLVESTIPTAIKLSGKVRDSNKVGIANVVIVLISPRGTVIATTTDADGNFSFTVPPSQRGYRLIPSREGYFFNPADKILSALKEDVSEVNFVGAIIGGDR